MTAPARSNPRNISSQPIPFGAAKITARPASARGSAGAFDAPPRGCPAIELGEGAGLAVGRLRGRAIIAAAAAAFFPRRAAGRGSFFARDGREVLEFNHQQGRDHHERHGFAQRAHDGNTAERQDAEGGGGAERREPD